MILTRFISLVLFLFLIPIYIIIYFAVLLIDGHPIFFKQKRIGKNNKTFYLYKFRSMKISTGDIPTHLLNKPSEFLTHTGKLLRKYSLDELPQIINIFKGDICFVGPRPALYNQKDLIELRTKNSVHKVMPGVTGWAQVNGRDLLSIEEKVKFDIYYCQNASLILDIKIIFKTIFQFFFQKGITH